MARTVGVRKTVQFLDLADKYYKREQTAIVHGVFLLREPYRTRIAAYVMVRIRKDEGHSVIGLRLRDYHKIPRAIPRDYTTHVEKMHYHLLSSRESPTSHVLSRDESMVDDSERHALCRTRDSKHEGTCINRTVHQNTSMDR